MKNAIMIHGMQEKEHYLDPDNLPSSRRNWFPFIQQHLIIKGILTQAPEMPLPYLPVYTEWKKVFEYFPLNEDTILIGHSCGAGFLIRYLSENEIKVGKVVFVAPWLDPDKYLEEVDKGNNFFDFKIDENLVEKTDGITVFYSTDDDDNILDSVKILKEKIPNIVYKEFTDRGHFTTEPGYVNDTFPELLEVLKID